MATSLFTKIIGPGSRYLTLLRKCTGRTVDVISSALEEPPSVSRSLSQDVIAQRIRARVLERNSWVPEETEPDPKILLPYLLDLLFPEVPSEELLDISFPVQTPQWEILKAPPGDKIQCTWLGHSTMLVQINGTNILTDPVFSKRCSATQLFGPKRFRKPACSIQDLHSHGINIDIVLVSHNHYDHLDYESIKAIASMSQTSPPLFVVPLGLKVWFQKYILNKGPLQVVEMDWHESIAWDDNLTVTSVPMRHWSSRLGFDRDKTLWCGYAVEGKRSFTNNNCSSTDVEVTGTASSQKFLFPGDTAWFEGLHEIGSRYGPFDLAGIPIGAYVPWGLMKQYHIDPPHAVKMMKAVQAKKAVPIHFGTFVLTCEPFLDPIEWLDRINQGIDFKRWNIGETISS